MSITCVNKAEQEQQEDMGSSITSSPAVSFLIFQAATVLRFIIPKLLYFSSPKQPVGGGQAPHADHEELRNISHLRPLYNLHINPGAR